MMQTMQSWFDQARRAPAPRQGRGRWAGLALAAALLVPAGAGAQDARYWETQQWATTWGSAPAGPPGPAELLSFHDQTLRLIVHTSIGGSLVRVRISNEFGSVPLRIGAAHIALRRSGAEIAPGSDRVLTFGGQADFTIPVGAPAISDPVALEVPALSDLAVSLHLPGSGQANTVHAAASQSKYVSPQGDFTGAASLPIQRSITSWPFLTEVDVQLPVAKAVVAFGDSITDGVSTTVDANHRWPDYLAARLQGTRGIVASPAPILPGLNRRLGVVNRGISGNRLLRTMPASVSGPAALSRFDRDVLATVGVQYAIVLLGINDIGLAGSFAPASEGVSAQELIAAYRQLISRAHLKGVRLFGGTLTPFEGTAYPGYYTPAKEQVRQAVNRWIRNSDEFDGVIDFDAAIRDPARPARMLPAYDSGDHLHPNDLGMLTLANAVPLGLFRGAALDTAVENK